MNWNRLNESFPPEGKTVLIWRGIKRIYVVGKLEIDVKSNTKSWRSATGNKLKTHLGDGWLEFPYLTITETFS